MPRPSDVIAWLAFACVFAFVLFITWGAPVQAAPYAATATADCWQGLPRVSVSWSDDGNSGTEQYIAIRKAWGPTSGQVVNLLDASESEVVVLPPGLRSMTFVGDELFVPGARYRLTISHQYNFGDQATNAQVQTKTFEECGPAVTIMPTSHSVTVRPESGSSWNGNVNNVVQVKGPDNRCGVPPCDLDVEVTNYSQFPSGGGTSSGGWGEEDREHAKKSTLLNTLGAGLMIVGMSGLLVFNVGKRAV